MGCHQQGSLGWPQVVAVVVLTPAGSWAVLHAAPTQSDIPDWPGQVLSVLDQACGQCRGGKGVHGPVN